VAIQAAYPDARVIALNVPDDEAIVIACAEAGISGYVTEDSTLSDLVSAIECASRGELHCSPRVAATLVRRLASVSRGSLRVHVADLTAREREILELVAEGLSNKQIAARLHIGLATVKNHVHHILEKLQVQSRSAAAALLRGDASRSALR
jgi:DNA-binding NarL/FixJ family response regulator